jgi:hypothetical protein
MMRLAAAVLVLVVVSFPVSVLPGPPVTWLAVLGGVVGGAGAVLLSVTLVTVGASVALIAYALALLIARPVGADPLAATGFGAALVVVLVLVHFAARADGAALGPAVLATQLRQWLATIAVGVLAATGLAMAAALLGAMLAGTSLPVVVAAAALGALLTVAGLIALTTRQDPPNPS